MLDQIVSIDNLQFSYEHEDRSVINDITFSINKGEWVALIGHNGSGKSTIAKLLMGLFFPDQGTIKYNGIRLSPDTVWDVRKKVGMVFQNPDNQFVGTTVKDDVAFGLENNSVPRVEMLQRIEESLKAVRMLDHLDQEPHLLSGGQKQRVAIAGVLAIQPELIILDEATGMLDPRGRKEVLSTIQQIKKEKQISVLSITHNSNEVLLADKVIVLDQGRKYAEGSPEEIFYQYQDKLEAIGLEIPFTLKLYKELKAQGINLEKQVLTQDELVDELWKLHART